MKEDNDNKIIKEALFNIMKLVNNQMNNKSIKGVATDEDQTVDPSIIHIEEQISTIKITGNNNKQFEVFFSIITKQGFGELIKLQILFLKKEKLSLSNKNNGKIYY